jgi:hypothetical protein
VGTSISEEHIATIFRTEVLEEMKCIPLKPTYQTTRCYNTGDDNVNLHSTVEVSDPIHSNKMPLDIHVSYVQVTVNSREEMNRASFNTKFKTINLIELCTHVGCPLLHDLFL